MATEEQQIYPKTAKSAINRHKERGKINPDTFFKKTKNKNKKKPSLGQVSDY